MARRRKTSPAKPGADVLTHAGWWEQHRETTTYTAETWRIGALCAQVDPEIFYPDVGQPTRPAKAVCATCPVRGFCLDEALETNERYGVWGGLSERERRAIRRQRSTPAATAIDPATPRDDDLDDLNEDSETDDWWEAA